MSNVSYYPIFFHQGGRIYQGTWPDYLDLEEPKGWYFWTKTWCTYCGPYNTREECEAEFNEKQGKIEACTAGDHEDDIAKNMNKFQKLGEELITVQVSENFVSTQFCGYIIGQRTPAHPALIKSAENFAQTVRQRFVKKLEENLLEETT